MTREQDGRNAVPPPDDDRPASLPVRSWSQLSTWSECATRWRLEKVDRAPRRPGVWFPAGTAFHSVIEKYLTERVAIENA